MGGSTDTRGVELGSQEQKGVMDELVCMCGGGEEEQRGGGSALPGRGMGGGGL